MLFQALTNASAVQGLGDEYRPITQSFTYDTDGNLTNDGVWSYSWDAENRLIQMQATSGAVSAGYPNLQLQFAYDYLGRRVQKRVVDLATSTEVTSRRFLYDGWNLVEEFTAPGGTSLGTTVRTYTWGLDIARSLKDAGGVGALVQISDYASGNSYFPTYDGNGNIMSLINGSSGALAAAYEYDPYGQTLRADCFDTAVYAQPFRFSTKFLDIETGLAYYGRRYYSPNLGRFIGRDPIQEAGGINLYGFVLNNPINKWDYLGLDDAPAWGIDDWPVGLSYSSGAPSDAPPSTSGSNQPSQSSDPSSESNASNTGDGVPAAPSSDGSTSSAPSQSNTTGAGDGSATAPSSDGSTSSANTSQSTITSSNPGGTDPTTNPVTNPSIQSATVTGAPSQSTVSAGTTYTGTVNFTLIAAGVSTGVFTGTVITSDGTAYTISGNVGGSGFQLGVFTGETPVSFTSTDSSGSLVGSTGTLLLGTTGLGIGPLNIIGATASQFSSGGTTLPTQFNVDPPGISSSTSAIDPGGYFNFKLGGDIAVGGETLTVNNFTPVPIPNPGEISVISGAFTPP